MAHLRDEVYEPIAANRPAYDRLYAEYVRLHDLFGRGLDPAMKTLKRLRLEALQSAATRPHGDEPPVGAAPSTTIGACPHSAENATA